MMPPVSSEMEIWVVTNVVRERYGSHLKLIDAFRLCVHCLVCWYVSLYVLSLWLLLQISDFVNGKKGEG